MSEILLKRKRTCIDVTEKLLYYLFMNRIYTFKRLNQFSRNAGARLTHRLLIVGWYHRREQLVLNKSSSVTKHVDSK